MSEHISEPADQNMTNLLGEVPNAESFNYVFAALRGIQSGREYYVTMVPLRLIPKLFLYDEKELEPALRAQRTLNRSRIPKITRYLLSNPKNYTFSSITASIDGRVEFKPFTQTGAASKTGYLIVPMSAKLLINDGQHRRAAIERALKENPDLGSETISVVFFVDAGLKRSQQMFTDLNKHAVRPTLSLSVYYDHRDPFARLSVRLAMSVSIFCGRTEFERTTISNRSNNLFTLSSIYHATKLFLNKGINDNLLTQEEEKLAYEFWTEVANNIKEWQLLLNGKISSGELRKSYIHSHGLALLALGIAGKELVQAFPEKWKDNLKGLEKIDWARSNVKLWEGRAMNAGRISAAGNNILLTSFVIKKSLDLELTEDNQALEQRLFSV